MYSRVQVPPDSSLSLLLLLLLLQEDATIESVPELV
jgi:hypothetical protein